ncbi:right-handed parallel beta-helix repeat-containing protein [bacterium]|nr:right-handed parallel beta-helix repeat-containing protein [bacterium]
MGTLSTMRHALVLIASVALAEVLVVPEDYPTIQMAIDSAEVRDTILLQTGEHRESVTLLPKGLTISGPFLLSGDTSEIRTCVWRSFSNGDDTLRCLNADFAAGPEPSFRVVGIRFAAGMAHNNEEGGAIRSFNHDFTIEHCIFDSCRAGYGGAIATRGSRGLISNCSFNYCGANRLAAVLRLVNSQVRVNSCTIYHSLAHHEVEEIPEQIAMRNSVLRIRDSKVYECGLGHNPNGTYLVYVSKPPDTLEIVNCEFRLNHFTNMIHYGGNYLNYLRLDSCHFHDNNLTGGIYLQGEPDSLTTLIAVGNVFESFSPVPMRGMHGIFGFDNSPSVVTITRNLIHLNSGGHTSFCTIFDSSRVPRTITNNYIIENSNHSVSYPPSGQVLLRDNVSTDLQYNVFARNQGYAVFQGNTPDPTYARHNYWNHATGPYDSVGNIGGQGDTVEWRIQYQPWEEDTSFFSAAPEPREPVEIPATFIGNAYPNPFNSTVTIEFVLLHL